MRIKVNRELCESNQLCVSSCPQVFKVDDNDELIILIENPDELKDLVEEKKMELIEYIANCDDEIADGITEFDLNSYNTIITGGNPDVTVTYHATQEFAEIGFLDYG